MQSTTTSDLGARPRKQPTNNIVRLNVQEPLLSSPELTLYPSDKTVKPTIHPDIVRHYDSLERRTIGGVAMALRLQNKFAKPAVGRLMQNMYRWCSFFEIFENRYHRNRVDVYMEFNNPMTFEETNHYIVPGKYRDLFLEPEAAEGTRQNMFATMGNPVKDNGLPRWDTNLDITGPINTLLPVWQRENIKQRKCDIAFFKQITDKE